MKHIPMLFCFLGLLGSMQAQRSYIEAIQQGDVAFNQREYKTAINKYFAAEAFDPSKKEIVKAKVNAVFDKIETLRSEAEKAKEREQKAKVDLQKTIKKLQIEQKKVKTALAESEILRIQTESALQKNNKLLDALYFYKEKFAVAIKVDAIGTAQYGYIDKNGDTRIQFIYQEALPFDFSTGFAKVKKNNTYYLIDTLGNEYKLAMSEEQIDENTIAIDLTRQNLFQLPSFVCKYKNIKILLLSGNRLIELPPEIGDLSNLEILDLRGNGLKELPIEFTNLFNLKVLYLKQNSLASLPINFGQLSNLVYLDLSENNLEEVPISIQFSDSLSYLNLKGNRLKSLPREIGQTNLKILNISFNNIDKLPDEISQIKNLIELDISFNFLTELPATIGQLKNLEYLNINSYAADTVVTFDPETYEETVKIYCNSMSIISLPIGIGELHKLNAIQLGGFLGKIPDWLCKSPSLKHIYTWSEEGTPDCLKKKWQYLPRPRNFD